MNTERAEGDLKEAPDPGASGYRQRRRVQARARRTRRVRTLLAGGVVGVLLLVVLLVAAGLLDGGGDQGAQAESRVPGGGGAVLLLVEEGGEPRAAVLARANPSPAMVLGMPADTLLQSSGRFETLAQLWQMQREAGPMTLESLPDMPAVTVSGISWAQLRGAALAARPGEELPESLPKDAGEAAFLAGRALASLCAPGEPAKEAVADLEATPAADQVREILWSLAGQIEQAQLLAGKPVRGPGFAYFEPDMRALRALLGSSPGATAEVEVQNGSGVVGVTEAVTAALQGAGYLLLPVRNADDFPKVQKTSVYSAAGGLSEAERVRQTLGIGQVLPQDDLPPGRIVVVVGHDLEPEGVSVRATPDAGALSGGEEQG